MFNKLLQRLKALLPVAAGKLSEEKTGRQDIGRWAEDQAKIFLVQQGLTLRDRNYRCKSGEIDLIMQDKQSLVFVEVRSRNNTDFGSALESVTQTKQRRLIRAAQHYLQKQRLLDKLPCRFDVVSVDRTRDIKWIPNAFSAFG